MWGIIGYSLLGLLGCLILLLILPVFVRIRYREELSVCVRVLGIPVYRYASAEEKPDKPQKQKKKATDKPKKEKKKDGLFADLAKDLKTGGVSAALGTVKALAKLAIGTLKRVFRAITVDRLQLQLRIAAEDAASTAIDTGRVCAVLYPSLSALQCALRIRHREVTVTPDYLAEKGQVTADVRLHIIPMRLLWAALWTVLKFGTVWANKTKETKEEHEDGK